MKPSSEHEQSQSKSLEFAQSIFAATRHIISSQQVRTALFIVNNLEHAIYAHKSLNADNLIWATHDIEVSKWLSKFYPKSKQLFWKNQYNTNLLTQVAYYAIMAASQKMLNIDEYIVLINWPDDRPYPNQLHVFQPNEEFNVIKHLNWQGESHPFDPTIFLAVIDIALALGSVRHPYVRGTMITVGDANKILGFSRPMLFEPFQFYPRDQRNILDPKIRKTLEKYTRLDAAFILAEDGTIEAVVEMVNPPVSPVEGLQGLGSRHTAASAISMSANAYVIVISQTAGNVTVFMNGQIVLSLKPQSLHF